MLHIFQSERSSASRGVPLFAPVMKAMHQLDGYLEAELVAARLAAAKSLFLISPDGAAYDGDDFEDYAPIHDVEPGSITQFKPGTEIQPWSPDHPTGAFKEFYASVLRSVASGLGISFVSLSNNANAQIGDACNETHCDGSFYSDPNHMKIWYSSGFIHRILSPLMNK